MVENQTQIGSGSPLRGKATVAAAALLIIFFTLLSLPKQSYLRQFSVPYDTEDKIGATNADIDISVNGSRDWHDYWTYASRKGKEEVDHFHARDDYVALAAESTSSAALGHMNDMRRRYASVKALADFYARGIGWIHGRLGMVLTVVIAGNLTSDSTSDSNNTSLHPGHTSIFVVDTVGKRKCGGRGDTWIANHPPLTMWVRANGPEIFAGTALPHPWDNHRCAWRYSFEARKAGVYSIHVKVLTFDGFVDSLSEECKTEKIPSRNDQFDGQTHNASAGPADLEKLEAMNYDAVRELAEQGNYSHHRGVSGFKMYDNVDACCEACTRSRNCKMWTTPGAGHNDNCELYFDRIEDDLEFLEGNGDYWGRDRNYSYVKQNPIDFPNIRRKLAISPNELQKMWPLKERPTKGFPRAGAVTYFIGCGWSSLLTFESPCHYPSDDLVFGSGQKVSILSDTFESIVNVSQSCSLDDEKLDVSNGRWVRYPYPDDAVCLEIVQDTHASGFRGFRPLYRGDRPPRCWHREDLTRLATGCAESGCGYVLNHRWMTDLRRENKWFGMWEPYDCVYDDMGDDLIQQCVDQKQISKIELLGASIKNIVDGYITQKLQNINMTKDVVNGTRKVILDTLKMPHILWHKSINEHRKVLENFPDVTTSENEHYWISGFYYTSEREPHVQVDRSLQYSRMAMDILAPKGYKMINGFDVTAAFSFDTSGQADGLHITGPPIKAIVTKFFHHLCHGVTLPNLNAPLPEPDQEKPQVIRLGVENQTKPDSINVTLPNLDAPVPKPDQEKPRVIRLGVENRTRPGS